MFELFDLPNTQRILAGLFVSIKIAFISIIFSFILGIIFGILMCARNILVRAFFRIYLEIIRITPILVLMFLLFFGLPQISSINLSALQSVLIIFIAWGAIEMGDLVRSAIIHLPKHQVESARALGLKSRDINVYIILPQIVAKVLPPSLNLASRIIKTTALAPLIGVVEVLKTGQQIIELNMLTNALAPFWIYGAIFILYFLLCYPLSLFGTFLEKKFSF